MPRSIVMEITFTDREIEIANMLMQGMWQKDICQELHIAKATIDRHTLNMRNKVGAMTNIEMISRMIKAGLI